MHFNLVPLVLSSFFIAHRPINYHMNNNNFVGLLHFKLLAKVFTSTSDIEKLTFKAKCQLLIKGRNFFACNFFT